MAIDEGEPDVVPEHLSKSSERAWKHRFAQVLYESFCSGGLDKAAALADAYAHADAQYLVRGLRDPEIEAFAALIWIKADDVLANTSGVNAGYAAPNPHNGAHHLGVIPGAAPHRFARITSACTVRLE